MTIREREYVFVRIDSDGRSGAAWSLTRGLPVTDAVAAIARARPIGADVRDTTRLWHDSHRAGGPSGRAGTAMRALSLLDIALWDLKAQAAGMPLHRLLGGLEEEVPVMAVSAYPGAGRSAEEMGERLAELSAAGHELVKAARWPEPRDTATLLSRAAVPGLVVDAAWAWEDAHSALEEIRLWGDLPLAWLEDALPAQRAGAYRRLREGCPHPLGIGDEVSDPDLLANLALDGHADVLRIDAAIAGGITGAQRLLGLCWHLGIPASLHVGLPIHIHLAASSPACIGVEAFVGEDIALDPIERLLADPPAIVAGRAQVPSTAGLGCKPDWEQIVARACSSTDSQAETGASTAIKEDQ